MITNKEDCVGLVEEISGYLDTITDALKGKDIESVDPAFKNTVDKFKRFVCPVFLSRYDSVIKLEPLEQGTRKDL